MASFHTTSTFAHERPCSTAHGNTSNSSQTAPPHLSQAQERFTQLMVLLTLLTRRSLRSHVDQIEFARLEL